jgi:uncharacterized protein (TIGR02147 family)
VSETLPFYRRVLTEELESRQKRNPSYSLRAFARDLDLQPSNASEIIRGLSGLSPQSGAEIAKKLGLSEEETHWFLTSIEAFHGRGFRKEKAKAKLESILAQNGFDDLSLERFKIISDWYHFALLELTDTKDFSSDPAWIAQRLNISETEACEAIERLIQFGLLEQKRDGTLKQTKSTSVAGGIPSREIRKHHSQILHKAEEALTQVEIDARDFSAITMAIPQSMLPEAGKLIRDFRRKLHRILTTSAEPKDRVYILGIQLFPVDDPSHHTKELK